MTDTGNYATAGQDETVIWGCGVCDPVTSCVSCETEKCNAAPIFTCLATDDFTKVPAQKVCPDTDAAVPDTFEPETKCVR